MTAERNRTAKTGLSTWQWFAIGSAAGLDPVFHGPRADLFLRLCQALARCGAKFGKLAAPHRLVHVLAHHSWFTVLCRYLVVAATALLAGTAHHRDAGRRRLGNHREFDMD